MDYNDTQNDSMQYFHVCVRHMQLDKRAIVCEGVFQYIAEEMMISEYWRYIEEKGQGIVGSTS